MRNIKVINYNNEEYPLKLKKIKNPPKRLYALGNIELLKKNCLAVIGTRNITEYGITNCKNFTQKIVERDIPIVSGMALGTDTIAHKTALEFGGETIAVLGSGFENIFPKENIELFNKILERNGLVITEYEQNVKPKSVNFLKRNRIVSGLSEGVLVIEAGYRSGTSVTARLAKNQGKIVMALPGRLDNHYGIGVNKLIQEGAKLVTSIEDIIECFPQFSNKKWKTLKEKQISFWDVKEEYQEIINILQNGEKSVEEIVIKTKDKNLRKTIELLINMELDDIIIQEIGKGYKINEKR